MARTGDTPAAPSLLSAQESAIAALRTTLDMMAHWSESAQAIFGQPRVFAEHEALLAERESGPLPPPAYRPAISVHRASTHAVAGAGTWLDKFVADIAELAAVWRRGVMPADEARLLCERCASTSGPMAAPANVPVALAAQCVVVAGAARRLLARLKKAHDGSVVAPRDEHQDRLTRGVKYLVTLMEELDV